jgi:hypothetical protein
MGNPGGCSRPADDVCETTEGRASWPAQAIQATNPATIRTGNQISVFIPTRYATTGPKLRWLPPIPPRSPEDDHEDEDGYADDDEDG